MRAITGLQNEDDLNWIGNEEEEPDPAEEYEELEEDLEERNQEEAHKLGNA